MNLATMFDQSGLLRVYLQRTERKGFKSIAKMQCDEGLGKSYSSVIGMDKLYFRDIVQEGTAAFSHGLDT